MQYISMGRKELEAFIRNKTNLFSEYKYQGTVGKQLYFLSLLIFVVLKGIFKIACTMSASLNNLGFFDEKLEVNLT